MAIVRYELERVAVTIMAVCVMVFIAGGNILVILSVKKVRHLRKPQNLLIISLAMTDVALAFAIIPVETARLAAYGRWIFGYQLCKYYVAVNMILATASVLNICAIATDRYLIITQTMRYLPIRTNGLMYIMIVVVYASTLLIIQPVLFDLAPIYFNERVGFCEASRTKWYTVCFAISVYMIPFTWIVLAYWKILAVARQTKRVNVANRTCISKTSSHTQSRRIANPIRFRNIDARIEFDNTKNKLSFMKRHTNHFSMRYSNSAPLLNTNPAELEHIDSIDCLVDKKNAR